MAKCHAVNGRAHDTEGGTWITIKSLHVALSVREVIFSFGLFEWFSDLVGNIDGENVRPFPRYPPPPEELCEWHSLSSDDWDTLWVSARVERHKLRHDGNYPHNLTRYRRGTLNSQMGNERLTFKNCLEGGPIGPRSGEPCRQPWLL